MKALVDVLKGKNAEIKTLTLDKVEMQKEMYDLYRAVNDCIDWGAHPFPEKEKNFDYSVGSIENILNAYGVDALVFVYGRDRISTTTTKVLNVTIAPLIVVGGILCGRPDVITLIRKKGRGYPYPSMSISLVDRSGAILWYNAKLGGVGYDLRNPKSASSLVQKVLSGFPEVGK